MKKSEKDLLIMVGVIIVGWYIFASSPQLAPLKQALGIPIIPGITTFKGL